MTMHPQPVSSVDHDARARVRADCAADEFWGGSLAGTDSGGAVLGECAVVKQRTAPVAIRVGANLPVLLELAIPESRAGAVACREAGAAIVDKLAVDDLELRALRDFAAADESGCPFEYDAGAVRAGEFRAREFEDAGTPGDADRGVRAELALPAILRDVPSGGGYRDRTRATPPSVAAIAEIAAPLSPSLSMIANPPSASSSARCVQSLERSLMSCIWQRRQLRSTESEEMARFVVSWCASFCFCRSWSRNASAWKKSFFYRVLILLLKVHHDSL
jgi:hypothetical protein